MFITDGPFGKSKYYAIRVEFQIRGNPNIHSVIKVINEPELFPENIDEYTDWVYDLIKPDLPNPETDSTLHSSTFKIMEKV